MFWFFFILYLIWAVPAWFEACDELEDMREAKRHGYDY